MKTSGIRCPDPLSRKGLSSQVRGALSPDSLQAALSPQQRTNHHAQGHLPASLSLMTDVDRGIKTWTFWPGKGQFWSIPTSLCHSAL